MFKFLEFHTILFMKWITKWTGINRKQSTRWQHLSWLKASAFFSLQFFFSCYKTQQLILGTGITIWWLKEPHWTKTEMEQFKILQWPLGGKAKSRWRLGMLMVNKLSHSYLSVMELENYGPTGECSKNNHQTSQRYKNGRPHFEILNKNQIKYNLLWYF